MTHRKMFAKKTKTQQKSFLQKWCFSFQSSMGMCSGFRDLVFGTVCTVGAVTMLLLAVVVIDAPFGLFVVMIRFPIDLYKSYFVGGNSRYFTKIRFYKDTKLLS